ncbi:MAG TPA: hypothetical protein VJV78_33640, partial [Polyangiales bacterium]|nr:hypothetical protein [Polyangiales bacterium]
SSRPCDADGGREIEWDTRVGGYSLDDALAELQDVGTQTIPTRVGAGGTQLELSVAKAKGAVCSRPSSGSGPDDVALTAPVIVRARTADATLDLDLPAVLQATAGPDGLVVEPSWSNFQAIRVRLSGRALTRSSQLTAADGGESARLRELASLASVEVEVATHPDGTSGALRVRPAEHLEGWPEFAWPEEPRAIALSRHDERCSGVTEQPPQFGGGWGAFAD